MTTSTRATPADRTRQLIVVVCAIVAVAGAFVGSGAAGGQPIAQAAGGALAADATPLAPAGPAFAIWSLIYLGLAAYAVWQALPRQATAARHRALGYPVAATLLLNAAWILSVQAGLLLLSVVVIAALLAALCFCLVLLVRARPTGPWDAIITDGTVGLYLGWVTVAAAANVAAWLVAIGFRGFGWAPDTWAIVVLGVVGAIAAGLVQRARGRLAPGLAIAWGVAWIAVGRLAGEPRMLPTGIAAVAVAALVVAMFAFGRFFVFRDATARGRWWEKGI